MTESSSLSGSYTCILIINPVFSSSFPNSWNRLHSILCTNGKVTRFSKKDEVAKRCYEHHICDDRVLTNYYRVRYLLSLPQYLSQLCLHSFRHEKVFAHNTTAQLLPPCLTSPSSTPWIIWTSLFEFLPHQVLYIFYPTLKCSLIYTILFSCYKPRRFLVL